MIFYLKDTLKALFTLFNKTVHGNLKMHSLYFSDQDQLILADQFCTQKINEISDSNFFKLHLDGLI